MPGPSPSSALQRPDLAATFESFDLEGSRRQFIGGAVAPTVEVQLQSANVGKLPLAALLAERDTARAPGGGYTRGDYQFDTFSFACEEHGAEEPVDDRLAKIYARYFDAEAVATKRALDVVLRNRERRVAALLFNASTWTGSSLTTAITNEWDDATNATPIADVFAAAEKVIAGSGLVANALILNSFVFRNLCNTDEIVDRAKYAKVADVARLTPLDLAAILFPDVPGAKIVVAGGIRNSANEGATASPARIWSNEYAMVARIAETVDPQEPCVARSFHWAGDGSQADGRVESYREEKVRSNIIRVRLDSDEVTMYAQAAHLLSNATT